MPQPVCVIFYSPTTRLYGFRFSFAGKRPHYEMDVFKSLEDVLSWVDPHKEMIWAEQSKGEATLMVSRSYRDGSVAKRLAG